MNALALPGALIAAAGLIPALAAIRPGPYRKILVIASAVLFAAGIVFIAVPRGTAGASREAGGQSRSSGQASPVTPSGSGSPTVSSTLPPSDVAFSFAANRVNQGRSSRLTYSTNHLPSGARLTLEQRQAGSADWAALRELPKLSGSVQAPAVSLGKYEYRIQVTLGTAVVATSAVHRLYIYGRVPLSTLCAHGGGGCYPDTTQIGDMAFSYSGDASSYYPDYYPVFTLNSTTCDAITITFASDDPTSGDHAYVKLVQSGGDTIYKTIPVGQIRRVSGALDGGPLIFDVSEDDAFGWNVYFKGSASCYTEDGQP